MMRGDAPDRSTTVLDTSCVDEIGCAYYIVVSPLSSKVTDLLIYTHIANAHFKSVRRPDRRL